MLLPSELEALARAKAAECIGIANQHFKLELPTPLVSFNLRGHTAGYANFRKWAIRINIDLLVSNSDQQIQNTVPHEIAHLVANAVYGSSISPHGWEWQRVMSLFGVSPTRCHKMQTTPARRVTRYKVHCGCSSGHTITKVLLKRMRQGRQYTCRKCGQRLSETLSLTPVKPSFDDLLATIK